MSWNPLKRKSAPVVAVNDTPPAPSGIEKVSMSNGTYVLLFSPRHAQSIDGGFLTGYRSLEDGRRTNTQMRIPVSIITDRVAMGWRQNERVLSEAPDLPLPSQMY